MKIMWFALCLSLLLSVKTEVSGEESPSLVRGRGLYTYNVTVNVSLSGGKVSNGVPVLFTKGRNPIGGSTDDGGKCDLSFEMKEGESASIIVNSGNKNPFFIEETIRLYAQVYGYITYYDQGGFQQQLWHKDHSKGNDNRIKINLPLSDMGKKYYEILTANKQKEYTIVAQKGKEYIDMFRNIEGSLYKDIEPLVATANQALKEEEESKQREAIERAEAEVRAKEVAAQEEARRNTPEYKQAVVAEELCQRYEELSQANQALKLSREVDAASGTVNLYERRQLGAAKVYLEKEIGRLKKEYKTLGGGEFSRKKQCE